MSKKILIIIAAVLTVIAGAGIGVFVFSQKRLTDLRSEFNADTGGPQGIFPLSQKSVEKFIDYQDESGYSFSYPDSISVKDATPADENYYSLLELKRGMDTLTIKITVGNTNPYKNDKSATLVGSTTMGSITANQYKIGGRLVSVAIDQGVLYVIDGPADSFWEEAQNKILSTFKFGTAETAATTDQNTTYEEEVIE